MSSFNNDWPFLASIPEGRRYLPNMKYITSLTLRWNDKHRSSQLSLVRSRKFQLATAGLVLVSITALVYWERVSRRSAELALTANQALQSGSGKLTKGRLAQSLADSAAVYRFPTEVEIPGV